MVMRCGSRIDSNVIRGKLHPTVPHAWLVGICKKIDRGPARRVRRMRNTRKSFVAPLHPELAEIDTCQFGAERPGLPDGDFHVGCADRSLIAEWVVEFGMGTTGHRRHHKTFEEYYPLNDNP